MYCTDHLTEVIYPLIPFIESSEICDENVKKNLSTMNRKEYDVMMSLVTGQKPVIDTLPSYSLYNVNIYNKKFSHHLDIFDESGDEHQITIQYDDGHIVLHTFSVESLILYLDDIKSRYVFLPIAFSSENKKDGHHTSLIIDKKENKFYLYDPNGRSSYFNNIFAESANTLTNSANASVINTSDFYFDGHELIDILMKGYVDDIKRKFGVKYEYVTSNIWNPLKKVLNPTFDKNSLIGSGHCVITTILFLHYLHVTNYNVAEAYQQLGSLNTNELIYLINGYSCWAYQTLRPLFDKRQKKFC